MADQFSALKLLNKVDRTFAICIGSTGKMLSIDSRKLKIKMRVRCASAVSCTGADNVAVNDPVSVVEDKNLAVEVDKGLKMMGYSKWNAVYL